MSQRFKSFEILLKSVLLKANEVEKIGLNN